MSISERLPGMKPGARLRNLVLGFGYVFLALSVLGAALPGADDPDETAAEVEVTDEPTDMPTDSTEESDESDDSSSDAATDSPSDATDTPADTETPTPTPTATPEPAEDGASYSLSGSGNDVTESFETEGGLVVFDFDHDGSSNFQVQAINENGDEEYLVNEIGTYDGQVALALPSGEWTLDVTADGSWSADVTQPRFNEQDIEDLPEEASGEHAAWFGPFEFEGTTEVTFVIEDDSQASVWLATHQGEQVDLLHNEIGPYEGTALITDDGVGLIIIDTDSAEWRIEIGG